MLFLARKNRFEQPVRLSFSILGVVLSVRPTEDAEMRRFAKARKEEVAWRGRGRQGVHTARATPARR